MPLVPHRFLVRLTYPCRYAKGIPHGDEDRLLDLGESYRLDNFAAMDDQCNFADVRVGWNEFGIGIQVRVTGKERPAQADADRPRGSDGMTVWIDTRDARTSHRASRYCHQLHFLPTGGGPDRDEPAFAQGKINRALHDAPTIPPGSVPFRCISAAGGYTIEAFLPGGVLHGFDPEQNRRLGFYYAIRDGELGEQVLSVGSDFPYWEDPSLWSVLELER
jgi:hypothetical protein